MESLSVCINWRAEEGGTTRRSLQSEPNAERARGEESNNVPVMEKLPKEFLALTPIASVQSDEPPIRKENQDHRRRYHTTGYKIPKETDCADTSSDNGTSQQIRVSRSGKGYYTTPARPLPKELGSG
jgi:hypothetical protein